MLIALSPDQSSFLWMLLIVLALDVVIIVLGAGLAAIFVVFKAGTGILELIDKTVRWIVNTAFRLAEDALESPPLDKVPFFQWALVGVKKAYDLFNAAQAAIMAVLNIVVMLVAVALVVLFALALAALNLAALWAFLRYVT